MSKTLNLYERLLTIKTPERIKHLTHQILDLHGAVLEETGKDLMTALLPDHLRRLLNFGTDELNLVFGQETTAVPNAQRMIICAPDFEKILKLAYTRGAKVAVTGEDLLVQDRLYFRNISDKVGFKNARIVEVKEEVPTTSYYSICTFKIVVTYDDVSEFIKQVMIANRTLADFTPHLREFTAINLKPSHNPGIAFERYAESSVIARAAEVVPKYISAELDEIKKSSFIRLRRDIKRLNAFFSQLHDETITSQTRSKATPEVMQAKISAIQTELKSKIAEVVQRYTLTIQTNLHSLMLLGLPVVRGKLIIQRKAKFRTVEVIYNPALAAIEPFYCEHCLKEASTPTCCDDQLHLLCDACLVVCPVCTKKFCRACYPASCPKCGKG